MEFGTYLMSVRKTVMNRTKWAEELGVSRATVEAYETKGRLPSLEYLCELATYSGVRLEEFISRYITYSSVSQKTKQNFENYFEFSGKGKSGSVKNELNVDLLNISFSIFNEDKTSYPVSLDTDFLNFENGYYVFKVNESFAVKKITKLLSGDYLLEDKESSNLLDIKSLKQMNCLGKVSAIILD